jgi:hypothetical protein
MGTKWLDPKWYRYLWHVVLPLEAKAGAVLALATLILVGGYFAANGLTAASGGTSSGADAYILQSTTVTRVVTVKRNGKTVVRRYPVVHTVRIRATAQTVQELRTVTTPQGVKTVPVFRVRYVPVKKVVNHVVTSVVTRNGKTRTVVTNHPVTVPVTVQQTVPTTVSQTETQVVTDERTTVRPVTTTIVSPPDTTTVVRESTTTVVETQTETVTRTLPQDTTTVLITVTLTNPLGG